MMGTLAAVLAKRKIRTHEDLYQAEVEGDVENVRGVIRITQIRATYHLKVPGDKAEEARDAFSSYLSQCPAAQSIMQCIAIRDNLMLEELTG